jgi:soluble lytic murein transglycosylase-like protein
MGSDYRKMAAAAAISHGIDPAKFQGLIQSESDFRNVVNPTSGAAGLGQFTKGTAKQYGLIDRMDPAANLDAAARYMSDLLGRTGGDWSKAIAAYKGVSAGGATMDDVQKALRMGLANPAATTASTSGFRQSVDIGGVSIFITQPGAGAQEIKRAVDEGIASALYRQSQLDVAQLAPAWG